MKTGSSFAPVGYVGAALFPVWQMLGRLSDGDLHGLANIPLLISGTGSDFKFGEEVNLAENGRSNEFDKCRTIADVLYDVAKACRLALETPSAAGRVFNVGSGCQRTLTLGLVVLPKSL